ncbi:hypothetical protein ACLB2K_046347 [Fragaria x ananassa]
MWFGWLPDSAALNTLKNKSQTNLAALKTLKNNHNFSADQDKEQDLDCSIVRLKSTTQASHRVLLRYRLLLLEPAKLVGKKCLEVLYITDFMQKVLQLTCLLLFLTLVFCINLVAFCYTDLYSDLDG